MLEDVIKTLAPPACPEGLGNTCPGPFDPIDPKTGKPLPPRFDRVRSESRPGEIDVSVRCRECQACAHYTLGLDGRIIEQPAPSAQGSDPLPTPAAPTTGLSVSPE